MLVVTCVTHIHLRWKSIPGPIWLIAKDEFEDLFLNDFILAQKRVACQCLDRLELNKNRRVLLAREVSCMMDVEDEKNGVVEVCVGYASATGVMFIDEMADVNERVRDLHILFRTLLIPFLV